MLENVQEMLQNRQVKPLGKQREYAVLLPLVQCNDEWHVLYEVRSKKISQPGETSFPGGSVEKGETFEEAAVRETMEELNIPRERINVLGEIDFISNEYVTIHCFVGYLDVDVEKIAFNEEVADIFTIPLEFLIENRPTYFTSEFHIKHPKDFPYDMIPNGRKYRFKAGQHRIPFYDLKSRSLWGYTANLTDHFIDLVVKKTT